MPTSQQIARMQAKLLTYLTETADIQRRVDGTDASGVPMNNAWALPHAEDVSCRVIDARARGGATAWREVAQTDMMEDMYRIVFPVGTDCDKNCRVIVGGRVYHVVAVVDDRTDAVDMQVTVKRVRGNDSVV